MLVHWLPYYTASKMVRTLKKFIAIFVVYVFALHHTTTQTIKQRIVRYKAPLLPVLSRTRSAYTTPFVGTKARLTKSGSLGLHKGSQVGAPNLSQVFLLIPMFWCTAQVNIKLWNLLFPLMSYEFLMNYQELFGMWVQWCMSLGWLEIGYKLAQLRRI
jgi:hypothetical protein